MTARIVTWLRLCAVVLAAGGLTIVGGDSAHAQTVGQAAPGAPMAAPAKVPAALPQNVAFARFIALIRGHLLTGEELVGRRQWDAARPHFSFPTEEIYGVIRDELRLYKTPPFDGALKALVRTVKSHSARHYPAALRKVEGALAAADAAVRAREPNWPRFVVTVAIEVLKTAPDEYDDVIANGRIVRPIGYQTARGFILQADRMIESVADTLTGDNAAPLTEMRAGLHPLKLAFAPVMPPKQAALTPAAMAELVGRVETAAQRIN